MEASDIAPSRRTLIFVNIIISCVGASLLSTALTTALPPIISDFGIEAVVGQWITSIYSLVMAIMIPMTAFLAKRVPTKPLYVGVLALFLAGTCLCMVSPSLPVMLVGRALQAAGAGSITAVGQMVLLSIYPADKRGAIMGWYGLALGAAPVVAPTIGGILSDTVGWRSIFLLPLIVMALSLVFALCVFESVLETEKISLDVPSFFLSAAGFGGVTYGVGELAAGDTGLSWIALIIGAIACVIFVRRQLALAHPFLDVRVFGDRRFRIGAIASMLLYLILMGYMTVLPLGIQDVMGFSATASGLALLPGSLVSTVMSPVAGSLYDRFGIRPLAVIGSILTVLAMAGFVVLVGPGSSIVMVAVLNTLRCLGAVLFMMPLLTWAMSDFDELRTTDGTALFNALNQVAGAIGMAVFVGVMGEPTFSGLMLSSASAALAALVLLVVCVAFARNRKKAASAE